MSSHRVVVVGDVLLDRDVYGRTERVCPDAPVPVVDVEAARDSPGGAGLTALLCASSGARVTLVAPIADDEAGARLAALLHAHVELLPIEHEGPTRCKTRVRSAGQSLLRIDDGGPGTPIDVPRGPVEAALRSADVVLVSDYGGGTTLDVGVRDLLAEAARRTTLVWDPHSRGGVPVQGAALVTPNVAEAQMAATAAGLAAGSHADQTATALRELWSARAVCVTAGAQGAYLALSGNEPMFVPAPAVAGGDPCGAGDRFAASAAVALANGAVLSEAVLAAVADASAWVAAGGAESFRRPAAKPADAAGTPTGPLADAENAPPRSVEDVVAEARATGATVVATGGCFDILHAGHIACLEAARRLGDVLIVVINSDESVRRLKGPGRPAVGVADRARVLQALSCVDAVGVFAEDDPRAALSRLRPDVWAKGGDYGAAPLPEAELVRSWGGRVVLLPYVDGRSTTSILDRAGRTHTPQESR